MSWPAWIDFRPEAWMQTPVWMQTPAAIGIAKTLLHSLWEGAVIALVLAAVLCVVRSSRARYAASCVAMVMLLGGLGITFARLLPEPPSHIRLTGVGLPPATARDLLGTLPPVPREARPEDDLAWLVPFWIAGVLFFYLRGMTSWMAARRLRHTGVCCAPELWQERLDRLRVRLRLARSVELLESCLAEVPVVIGYLRPVILMPVGLATGLPVEQVEAILLHELAHIRRYDYAVNLMQVFVEGLLFYHPAVWWISGVMRVERENCCDDLVVALTGGAYEYATALTALEQRRENGGMALAATGGSLVKRIQRLIGPPQQRYVAAMPVFTAAILTVSAVTAMAALFAAPATSSGQSALRAAASNQPILLAQVQQIPPAAPRGGGQQNSSQPDKVLFDRAIKDIESRKYDAARIALNTLIDTYTTSEYVTRAKLAIADSWYREGGAHGRAQAKVEYRDFILFYPNTPEAKEAELKLALIDPFTKWLDEDVVYIISDEERKAYLQLQTDEERTKFVEQFWDRRDPTPATARNEFKEEHYRRIAYANEHFAYANTAGWQTDRGRIYIQYGPPDGGIEAHPDGRGYQRPPEQGDSAAGTFPFELWRYRWIEGKGQNVVVEFDDTKRNGEYRMTMDPHAQPGAPGR